MCFFFCLNHKIVTDSRRTSSTTCTFSFNFCGARGAYRLTVSVQLHASTSGNSFNKTPFRTRINAHIWSCTGDNQQYACFSAFSNAVLESPTDLFLQKKTYFLFFPLWAIRTVLIAFGVEITCPFHFFRKKRDCAFPKTDPIPAQTQNIAFSRSCKDRKKKYRFPVHKKLSNPLFVSLPDKPSSCLMDTPIQRHPLTACQSVQALK